MPYRWTQAPPDAAPGTTEVLTLWPYRSLAPRGFVWFIGLTAALLSVPLLAQIGTAALWIMLAFVSAAVAGVWIALARNAADRSVTEVMTLAPERLTLVRQGPHAPRRTWEANPHWVRLTLHPTAGPVPDYLTLTGGGREVELGAFLVPAERRALRAELQERLARLRGA